MEALFSTSALTSISEIIVTTFSCTHLLIGLAPCGILGGNEYPMGSRVACYIGVGKTPTVAVYMYTIRVEYYSILCSTYYID
jgi:hypothetical protein